MAANFCRKNSHSLIADLCGPLDGTVDLSGGQLRCLCDDMHSTLFVLMKKGGRWMFEVFRTWIYATGMVGLGNKDIT
jgi:hypothetical protein